ncbi:MAG: ATP-binding protein [Acidobacteriota bacterium]
MRLPDHAGENAALTALAREMTTNPRNLPQRLVDLALDLCRAGSAGISLLRESPDGDYFEWTALSGFAAPMVGGRTPRNFSPCGLTLDLNAAQLFRRPYQAFPYLDIHGAPILEAIVVPFHSEGRPIGTIWILSHLESRRFDVEDVRIMTSLAEFTGAALHLLSSLDRATHLVEELTIADEALRKSDHRKDEFLAMLGHELRNPLGAMASSVELLKTAPEDRLTPWTAAVLDRQLGHVTRLVDDLLDVSRVTHGRINLEKRAISLADVVANAVEATRPSIESRRQELTIQIPDTAVLVEGDAARLGQIVSNLLDNASKYSPEGGRIALSLEARGHEAVLSLSDTGIGIPTEMLQSIFELFVQGGRGPDRSSGGLGLGLALARQLALLHGGSLEAFSEGPGRGSLFVLVLPALSERRPAAPMPEPASPVRSRLGPRRILVVDDNADAVSGLTSLIELEGHETRAAHDGAVALQIAESFAPDVVLLDIGLPGLDGYAVARRLRELPATRSATLIAVTGYGQEEDRRRALQAGFDRHVVKPIRSVRELLDSILESPAGESVAAGQRVAARSPSS